MRVIRGMLIPMNTKHQVLNRKIVFCFTKAKHAEMQK